MRCAATPGAGPRNADKPRSLTEADRGCLASGQSSAEADLPARSETQSPPERITFLTTFRDTPNSRQIALIGLPCLKNARRTA
jgi:hypothetical protein